MSMSVSRKRLRRWVAAMAASVAGVSFMPAATALSPVGPPPPAPPSSEAVAHAAAAPAFASPDGRLSVRFSAAWNDGLNYEVLRDGKPVVRPSPLWITTDGAEFFSRLSLVDCTAPTEGRERYTLVGKRRDIDRPYRAMRCELRNGESQRAAMEWRAFDDGVAFRYVLQDPAPKRNVHDGSGVRFPPGTRAFLQPMQVWRTGWKSTNPAYEEHYAPESAVGAEAPAREGFVLPALFRSGDTWIAVTEAGMDGRYHASRLRPTMSRDGYDFDGPQWGETWPGRERFGNADGPLTTPWRVLAIGELKTLVESTLGTDLAAPAIDFPKDKVQPGPASWSWALLKDDGTVEEVQRRFIDYAADMHWPYTLIDADWDRKIGWDRIQALVAHAARRHVGIWLWYNSSGDWNETEYTPKGRLIDPVQRRAEFAKLAAAGIKGVKIDFFGGDGQGSIRYYVDLLEDAARAGLLVNFHGATLPRGWNRTYPNLMTAEAVKGFEFATFEQADQDAVPRHLAMLPYTRNLFDPMDFTPVVFGDIPGIRRATRNGFELALSVLLVSGVQHYAETPQGMARVPAPVRAFLRDLPRQWDDVRFLAGQPGETVALARRAGDRWFVAAINAGDAPRDLTLDLGFLAGRTGAVIGEGKGPRDFRFDTLRGGGQHRVTLPAKGGFVASFGPGRP
ncbi:glycoside hydrolase family 97 protein [Mitsuaria sp. GD03876]|uniref:glycoside hydrolase family 97 protein n=1 Tax=Mitsuaria sp. GD03876 TaxID=2975399 RepID=UPI00244BA104|nr:glycoside hydrolase family 97 protein [Mitsuaria sp. GD03876]MDH0865811.1 glycoside hydrolase family 97 protein [Mitsuaria sp. GD03876]